MVTLLVDNIEIEAPEGASLLKACLDNGIYIPNLCYLPDLDHPPASCRLCMDQLEGHAQPVTSCTVRVREGMVVRTDTPVVRRLQRRALQLLLSVHRVDCAHCPANKRCALQRIAAFLKVGLKPKGLEPFLKTPEVDNSHPFLDYYPNRCVLCGRCIYVCRKSQGTSFLTFAKRGVHTIVSFYGENTGEAPPCPDCHACADSCPVGAITLKNAPPPSNPT